MSHGSFFWYDLVTKDWDASKAFLMRLFDWDATDVAMPNGAPYTSFSKDGQLTCGLMPLTAANDYDEGRAHWMTYVQVDRLFSTITRAERHGGEILSEVKPIPDLGSYQVLRDPSGALFSLVEASSPILSSNFAWNSIIWNELTTRNPQPAAEFYRAVTGWTATAAQADLDYAFFAMGGVNMAGLLAMQGPDFGDLRSGWQTYFAVEDVDATVARVEACGGHVAAHPFDLPGVGRVAIIIEPGQGTISLLTPPA